VQSFISVLSDTEPSESFFEKGVMSLKNKKNALFGGGEGESSTPAPVMAAPRTVAAAAAPKGPVLSPAARATKLAEAEKHMATAHGRTSPSNPLIPCLHGARTISNPQRSSNPRPNLTFYPPLYEMPTTTLQHNTTQNRVPQEDHVQLVA